MSMNSTDKIGGLSLIAGALLFAAYAVLFPLLLPVGKEHFDMVTVVMDGSWMPLAATAFIGILLMMAGFYALYMRIRPNAGTLGAFGFVFIELAWLLQACKVTWELFIYPVLGSYMMTGFLLRDGMLRNSDTVTFFRGMAAVTILLGIVLFCLALHHSRAFPKAAAPLIFAGALVYAVGPLISIFVSVAGIFMLAAGCLLAGAHLFRTSQAA